MTRSYCGKCNQYAEHNSAGCTECWPRSLTAVVQHGVTYDEIEVRAIAERVAVEDETAKNIADWLYSQQLLDNNTLTEIKRGAWRRQWRKP